ncbi:MAG: hypothetical protein ACOC0E_12210 [Spirochaetota bacterium]
MKKVALLLVLVIGVSMFASAQARNNESELYVTTLYVEKVYPTTLGYRIDYRRQSSLLLATSYLPLDWFGGPDAIGKLVYTDNGAVPFVNVFWRDAEISHFVLYVDRNINALSWGSLPATEGLESRFDLESPEFTF